jgi:hypothetical protein
MYGYTTKLGNKNQIDTSEANCGQQKSTRLEESELVYQFS